MAPRTRHLMRPTMIALAALILAAATGAAFASWLEQTPGIFMAMVESGLAWCF